MEIIIRPNSQEVAILGAKVIAQKVKEKPDCVLGLATGRTPVALYQELIRMHREEGLDFSQVSTFNLDEYVGLAADHNQSYRWFMNENFFDHINIKKENTHVPNGMAECLREECRNYERKIADAGGIDVQLLGIGSNGHIGFNEPTGSLNSRTWVKILSKSTITDNSDLFDKLEDVPRYCLTMGIGTILEARKCLVLANGHRKSKAVSEMIEGPISSMCPASALQYHQQVTAIFDEEAAARLNYADHYRWIDENKLTWQRYD